MSIFKALGDSIEPVMTTIKSDVNSDLFLQQVQQVLVGLEEGFEVEVLDNAWYSTKAITNALGADVGAPTKKTVRVHVPGGGVLELHEQNGSVSVLCYCCFGGNPNKGVYPIADLREAVIALKDHYCPPWPG